MQEDRFTPANTAPPTRSWPIGGKGHGCVCLCGDWLVLLTLGSVHSLIWSQITLWEACCWLGCWSAADEVNVVISSSHQISSERVVMVEALQRCNDRHVTCFAIECFGSWYGMVLVSFLCSCAESHTESQHCFPVVLTLDHNLKPATARWACFTAEVPKPSRLYEPTVS